MINEAVSFGLPIISTDHCVAAVQFNNHYHNARIIPKENIKQLRDAVLDVIHNDAERHLMSLRSRKAIRKYNYQQMCADS